MEFLVVGICAFFIGLGVGNNVHEKKKEIVVMPGQTVIFNSESDDVEWIDTPATTTASPDEGGEGE